MQAKKGLMGIKRKKRALVIAEDGLSQNFLLRTLEEAGFDVSAAITAVEGVEKTIAQSPDIVICNNAITDNADALSALKAIRAQTAFLYLARFAETTRDTEIIKEANGEILQKPFNSKELIHKITEILRRK